jgi:hypothetical protein
VRLLVVLAVTLLTLSLAATTVAEPQYSGAKKCFKKKRGKRVRVKCPKKKTTPVKPAPTPSPPAPVAMTDPVAIGTLTSLVSGGMLHRFATSDFGGDEKLSLCPDGTYKYVATLDEGLAGLAGLGKTLERGTWRVTGADFSADRERLDGGLLLVPSDGSSPHLAKLAAIPGSGGVTAFLNDTQWYVAPETLCG